MSPHQHTCVGCGGSYPCALACDELEDGEAICSPCAIRRFDEIKPQEFGVAIEYTVDALGNFDVMSGIQRRLVFSPKMALEHQCGMHAEKIEECPGCFPPPPVTRLEELGEAWRAAGCTWRGFARYLRARFARWIGGSALREHWDYEEYEDDEGDDD